MKFKQILCALLAALLLFSLAACGRAPLQFNASYTYSDPDNRFEEPALIFKDDGSFSFTDSNDGLRIRGTYVLDEEAGRLALGTENGRYSLMLSVKNKNELQLVSFSDAQGKVTLSIPENAIFNIGNADDVK